MCPVCDERERRSAMIMSRNAYFWSVNRLGLELMLGAGFYGQVVTLKDGANCRRLQHEYFHGVG